MRDVIRYMMRGAGVTRYHTFRTVIPETAGQHAHGVAALAYILYGDSCSRDLLVTCLFHDTAEGETGDHPGHIKRLLGYREKMKELESVLDKDAGLALPQLSRQDLHRLEFCDKAQGALYCLEELARGNRIMMEPISKYLNWMREMAPLEKAEDDLYHSFYEERHRYVTNESW